MKSKIVILFLLVAFSSACLIQKPAQKKLKLKGISWRAYSTADTGLQKTAFQCLTIDGSGNRWFGTMYDGLAMLSADGSWIKYNTTNSKLPDNCIRSIAGAPDGTLWIGSSEGGLVKFDGADFSIFDTSNSALLYNHVFKMTVDKKNTVWFSSSVHRVGGLMSYNGNEWKLYTPANSLLPTNLIKSVYAAPDESIWVATALDGILRLKDGIWSEYKDFYAPGVPKFPLDDICSDFKGNVWVSSSASIRDEGGTLAKFDGNEWQEYPPSTSGFCSDSVICMTSDRHSNIWASMIGDYEKNIPNTLIMFNGEEWFNIPSIDPSFPHGINFSDMKVDENNTIWATCLWPNYSVFEIHPEYE